MNDLLSRLLAAELGQLPRLQPRAAPRLTGIDSAAETAGIVEEHVEREWVNGAPTGVVHTRRVDVRAENVSGEVPAGVVQRKAPAPAAEPLATHALNRSSPAFADPARAAQVSEARSLSSAASATHTDANTAAESVAGPTQEPLPSAPAPGSSAPPAPAAPRTTTDPVADVEDATTQKLRESLTVALEESAKLGVRLHAHAGSPPQAPDPRSSGARPSAQPSASPAPSPVMQSAVPPAGVAELPPSAAATPASAPKPNAAPAANSFDLGAGGLAEAIRSFAAAAGPNAAAAPELSYSPQATPVSSPVVRVRIGRIEVHAPAAAAAAPPPRVDRARAGLSLEALLRRREES